MIGDVAARHRQRDAADRRQTLRRDQQESRDAFARVAAAEQEYTLVGAVESALEGAVLPGRIGSVARRGAARQDGVRHGFGGRIAQTIFDPEHVALLEEAGQLTVPVDVKMTGSNGDRKRTRLNS